MALALAPPRARAAAPVLAGLLLAALLGTSLQAGATHEVHEALLLSVGTMAQDTGRFAALVAGDLQRMAGDIRAVLEGLAASLAGQGYAAATTALAALTWGPTLAIALVLMLAGEVLWMLAFEHLRAGIPVVVQALLLLRQEAEAIALGAAGALAVVATTIPGDVEPTLDVAAAAGHLLAGLGAVPWTAAGIQGDLARAVAEALPSLAGGAMAMAEAAMGAAGSGSAQALATLVRLLQSSLGAGLAGGLELLVLGIGAGDAALRSLVGAAVDLPALLDAFGIAAAAGVALLVLVLLVAGEVQAWAQHAAAALLQP